MVQGSVAGNPLFCAIAGTGWLQEQVDRESREGIGFASCHVVVGGEAPVCIPSI